MDSSGTTTVAPLNYAGTDVYRERQPGWRRRFTLAGDRLVIHSKKIFGTESEIPIALRYVDPVHARVWKSNRRGGLGSLFLAAVFAGLAFFMLRDSALRPSLIGIGIDAALALMCLVTGLLSLRRIEFASFGHSGGPRFDIARSGPDRDRFDAFVARILDRVNELRAAPVRQTVNTNREPGRGPAENLPKTTSDSDPSA